MARFFLPLVASLLAAIAIAHPGHGGTTEMKSRAAYLSSLERTSLAPCASQLEASGHASKIIARREAEVAQLRQKRGLDLSLFISWAEGLSRLLMSRRALPQGQTDSRDGTLRYAGHVGSRPGAGSPESKPCIGPVV